MDASIALSLAIQLIQQGLKISALIQQSHAEGREGKLTKEEEQEVRDGFDAAILKLEALD